MGAMMASDISCSKSQRNLGSMDSDSDAISSLDKDDVLECYTSRRSLRAERDLERWADFTDPLLSSCVLERWIRNPSQKEQWELRIQDHLLHVLLAVRHVVHGCLAVPTRRKI